MGKNKTKPSKQEKMVDTQNENHNSKKEGLGRNTDQK